jgi:hypothetical protein
VKAVNQTLHGGPVVAAIKRGGGFLKRKRRARRVKG